MSGQTFWATLKRRWWVILLTVAIAVGGALAYAHRQSRVYEARATLVAHPSVLGGKTDLSGANQMLAYSTSFEGTFASIAESTQYLRIAGQRIGLVPSRADRYTAVGDVLPGTLTLQISVDGPDAAQAARLADSLAVVVGSATVNLYRMFSLQMLDVATVPATPISPKPTQAALDAALGGLIVGYVLGVLSLNLKGPFRAPARLPLDLSDADDQSESDGLETTEVARLRPTPFSDESVGRVR